MFLPRIFIICTFSLVSEAQNYYRTSLHHGLPTPDYGRPAPFVHHELHQQHQQHQEPRPVQYRQEGPGVETRSGCTVNHLDQRGEVCVPTFTTDCVKEDLSNGVVIQHRENCYPVTKTVCTEDHEIEDMEVCATRLNLISLEAEAKVVSAVWTEKCEAEKTCVPSPGYHPGHPGHHGQHCTVRHVCEQSPSLLPLSKVVSVKLPQPVETCLIKQVLLPRIKCQQVTETRCSMAASTQPAAPVKMDKCSVEVDDLQCTELLLQLPRQVCPARRNKTLAYSG